MKASVTSEAILSFIVPPGSVFYEKRRAGGEVIANLFLIPEEVDPPVKNVKKFAIYVRKGKDTNYKRLIGSPLVNEEDASKVLVDPYQFTTTFFERRPTSIRIGKDVFHPSSEKPPRDITVEPYKIRPNEVGALFYGDGQFYCILRNSGEILTTENWELYIGPIDRMRPIQPIINASVLPDGGTTTVITPVGKLTMPSPYRKEMATWNEIPLIKFYQSNYQAPVGMPESAIALLQKPGHHVFTYVDSDKK